MSKIAEMLRSKSKLSWDGSDDDAYNIFTKEANRLIEIIHQWFENELRDEIHIPDIRIHTTSFIMSELSGNKTINEFKNVKCLNILTLDQTLFIGPIQEFQKIYDLGKPNTKLIGFGTVLIKNTNYSDNESSIELILGIDGSWYITKLIQLNHEKLKRFKIPFTKDSFVEILYDILD